MRSRLKRLLREPFRVFGRTRRPDAGGRKLRHVRNPAKITVFRRSASALATPPTLKSHSKRTPAACHRSPNKLWKILKEMGIPDHLTCLLRNLNTGQEATVRTAHGTTDWFQIRKEVCQGRILSPCLFNFYAEYIMRNTGMEEAQAGIKIAGRNINNLRYADDTTLRAESEEELKSLLMKVKEESQKVGLKLNIWLPTLAT